VEEGGMCLCFCSNHAYRNYNNKKKPCERFDFVELYFGWECGAMKNTTIYIALLLISIFVSCMQKSNDIHFLMEKEFELKGIQSRGTKRDIQFAPDWKATAYYKNEKAIVIFIKTMPERGFTTKYIYCDTSGTEIDKIIYRK